jgi:two-component sensor histidine kinase
LPPGFDADNAESLGMKLIASLGHQLGGQPEWQDAHPGTRFVLEFLVQERSTLQLRGG